METRSADAVNPTSLQYVQGLIRLLLELGMLAGFAYWGWHNGSSTWQHTLLAIALPVGAATAWSIFRTPGGESAGQTGKVVIPGAIRIALELVLFLLAAYGLWTSGARAAAETLLTFTVLHYILTWQRVSWMLRH